MDKNKVVKKISMREGYEKMNEVGKPIDEIEHWEYQEFWRHYTDTDSEKLKSEVEYSSFEISD